MNNKQSSVVPFKVRSVQTGTDITENIKLTAIETKGTSVPFFQANDNDTFTVINADQKEDKLIDTVFKFDVTDNDKTYSLEAESKVNVKAYPAGTFEIQLVTNNGRAITARSGYQGVFEIRAKYQGQQLPASEFVLPPTSIDRFGTFVESVDQPDGITKKITWKAGIPRVFDQDSIRVDRKTLPENPIFGVDYASFTCAIMISDSNDNELQVALPAYLDRRMIGSLGFKMRVYPIVTWDSVVIPLTQSGLTIAPLNITLSYHDGANRISVDEKGDEYIECTIKNTDLPPAGKNQSFVWNAKYGGKSSYSVAVFVDLQKDETPPKVTLKPLSTVVPNKTQKVVFGAINLTTEDYSWLPFTTNGAAFISGSLILKTNNNVVLTNIDIAGLTPDQIGRYIESLSTIGAEQVITITGVLGCPRFYENKPIYGVDPVPVNALVINIPEGVYSSWASPELINNTGDNYINISIQEEVNGKLVDVAASGSKFTATGAVSKIAQPTAGTNGTLVVNVTGNGSNGEVLITGDVTGLPPANRQYKYSKTITAGANDGIVVTPSTVPVAVWDVLDQPPFVVKLSGADVTSNIRNLELIPNANIINDIDNPGKWVVDTAKTSGESVTTFFSFEVEVAGVWIPKVAFGVYQIAAWDGKVLKINPYYGPFGELTVGLGSRNSYTIKPTIKNKPVADRVRLSSITGMVNGGATIVSQVVESDGETVTITIAGTGKSGGNTATFKYVVSDTPATTPDVDMALIQTSLQIVNQGIQVIGGGEWSPSTVGYNRLMSWRPGVYVDGIRVKLNDPRLTLTLLAGQQQRIIRNAGATEGVLYAQVFANLGANGSYHNLCKLTFRDGDRVLNWGGVIGTGNINMNYQTSLKGIIATPVLQEPVIPSVLNEIPVKVTDSNGRIMTNPGLVTDFITEKNPSNGNAVAEGKVTLTPHPTDKELGILRFIAGHTGDTITLTGVMKSQEYTEIGMNPFTVTVPKAPIEVKLGSNTFNGASDSETKLTFNLSQKRYGIGEYNFSDSSSITVTATDGSIKGTRGLVKNENNGFDIIVIGNGVIGPAAVKLSIIDGGITYLADLELEAVIDSSKFKLEFTPKTITGKKGDKVKLTASLTNDGTAVAVDGQGVDFTFEPDDVIQVNSREKDSVTFEILKEVPEDQTLDVKTSVKYQGMTTSDDISVTLTGALVVTKVDPTVNVWDKSAISPLKFMLGTTDVTSSVNSITFVETDLVKHNGDKGGYQIVSDKAIPETKQDVTYTYKYAADSKEVQVVVPFTIKEYAGGELVVTTRLSSASTGPNGELFGYVGGYTPVYFSGKLRNVPVGELNIVNQTAGASYTTPRPSPTYNAETGETTIYFDFKNDNVVFGKVGLDIKVKASAGNVEGVDWINVKFNVSVITSDKELYVSNGIPLIFKGKLGDEQVTKVLAYFGPTQVSLNNSILTVGPTNTDRVKVVDDSLTKDTLKVQFTKDTDEEIAGTGFNITFTYKDPTDGNKVATASMVYNQLPLYQKLTMGEGFQTSGSGDIETPLTLKQFVLKPE